MNKKEMMAGFIKRICDEKLMTSFIKILFDYEYFNDYNYIFRMKEEKNRVIIDIYDNISDNRFNRYIFIFKKGDFEITVLKEGNVYVTYIYVFNVTLENATNKLLKLGYLFCLRKNRMVEYANTFLDGEIVKILEDIINNKKNIHD